MEVLCNGETGAKTIYPALSIFETNSQIAFIATGLSVGEEILLQISINGTTWEQLKQYGVSVKLSSTTNAIGIYCPARVRLVKPITANPVYVAMSTTNTTQH